MKIKNNLEIIKEKLSTLLTTEMIGVDMTAGNGYDTLFLSRLCKRVYCFDIQEKAINATKSLTKDFSNITYIHDSHHNIDKYINEKIDCVIYNLGYLPTGDKNIITTEDTTIKSLDKCLQLFSSKAYLIITAYPKHEGGYQEYIAVDTWIKNNNFHYELLTYDTKLSPVSYLIYIK